MSGWALIISLIPCRTTGWSSRIRTRRGPGADTPAFMRLPYSLAMDIGTRAKYRHRVSIELIPEYISLSELYLLKNHLIVN